MDWNKMRDQVHRLAVSKGWWEKPLTFSEIIVMCHSELSEAVEEYRAGRPMVYHACTAAARDGACGFGIRCRTAETAERDNCHYRAEKPEGVAVELADCILRILDYMGQVGGDVDGMMRDLGSLAPAQPGAGVKKTLPDLLAGCHYLLSSAYMSQRSAEMLGRRKGRKIRAVNLRHPFRVRDFERTAREKMVGCILDILRWASANGVDMEEIIAAKHEYNKAREYRHGGKRL